MIYSGHPRFTDALQILSRSLEARTFKKMRTDMNMMYMGEMVS